MSCNNQNVTKTGEQIAERLKLLEPDILHEHYSCTIDVGRELSGPYQTQMERAGFEVIHEESTIYTIVYES